MKFWPSTHPRSRLYPNEQRRYNEDAEKKRMIALLRRLAFEAMDPDESVRLYAAADELAQRPLPIKPPQRKIRQLNLFDSPSISGADPETLSWEPGDDD